MFKTILAVAALAFTQSLAFVPTPLTQLKAKKSPKTELRVSAFDNAPGATAPFGFWDPLGISNGLTPQDKKYKFMRAGEIKNGRLAMLAILGYALPYYYKLENFKDVRPGFDALLDLPGLVVGAIFLTMGFLDYNIFGERGMAPEGEYEGSLGGFFWKGPEDAEENLAMQNREINNGRIAMIGFMAMLAQDLVTNADFPFTEKA
uniref:Plastid light harvesting protein n=1 Tax=Chromera velia CCMP2878 TaxID=1169474 RepID=A0A0G4HT39_9ALVE|eukprot:Cvel_31316.t1-p1 / transcript=Cvel_31316.t1 / gene=Cvel_31316 / organism=Chromera_velia_CCMP2878 / gene_product=Fucoxanthin-chlorophyll a-c binding protein A,, putative / transcript_product=Fucoxanthin-chlorophyll a-c binding protein A,, putative / location=Cvel_scaffold4646:1677-3227(-) / protein_length=203 / sequence_SO=supercontig / SO=protein_coding / is_pseudo=false